RPPGDEVVVANPDAHRLTPDCKVSLAGKKLELDKDARLTRVDVDLDVDLFGQCALTFNDPKLALINGQDFKAGAQIKVELGYGARLGKVFEGEVVALEPQFRRDLPPSLRVVCQESLHRLALKTATRATKEKREIVGKAKGEGETGEGSKKHGGSATLAFAGDEHIPADVATAEAMAKGRMRKLAEGFVTAQVEMIGNAGVQPGTLLTFDKMGEKLDGKYRVEKARHEFGKHGYLVKFDAVRVSKKKPAPAQAAPPAQQAAPRSAQEALSWIALEVVDDQGKPIPNLRYEMITPDGRRLTGTVGADGKARIEAIKKGTCKIEFPELPDDSWKPG